jgi:hypothetical protein
MKSPNVSITRTRAGRGRKPDKSILMTGSIAALILGAWMIISPSPPELHGVTSVSASFAHDIWGLPAGVVMIVGAVLCLLLVIRSSAVGKLSPPGGRKV